MALSTPHEILRFLVGLKECDDLDLLQNRTLLTATVGEAKSEVVVEMAALVDQLLSNFDYTVSREYQESIRGKSDQFQNVSRKMVTIEKQKMQLLRLGQAVSNLLISNESFSLLPVTKHDALNQLKRFAESLSENR